MDEAKPLPEVVSGALEDVLVAFHERAMAKDDPRASEARLYKLLANAIDEWLTGEHTRQTPAEDVIMAALGGSLMLFFSTVGTVVGPDNARRTASPLREMWTRNFDRYLAGLAAAGNQKEKADAG